MITRQSQEVWFGYFRRKLPKNSNCLILLGVYTNTTGKVRPRERERGEYVSMPDPFPISKVSLRH